ncbi:hypothetical protein [Planococcus halocryophilus]|uniref:hypothetical protein n=1 Tax=Planococcus halocryophilus TaxID=1215089 RepID=UPI001F0FFBAB|nr:hypothetical protein [Planococcus halocryophilus]MCH4828161.1 hypothetical protein [Planococcus halocryophilus]
MMYKDLLEKNDYFISFRGSLVPNDHRIALRIILYGSYNETDLLVGNQENLDVWHIDFFSYATYSVTFEDFTVFNDSEVFLGEAFRIYQQSDLMHSLKKRINFESQELNKGSIYTHYSLACMEHQVDIVSDKEPSVKKEA